MKTYIKRLRSHPGVPIAFIMTAMGAFAGALNESMTIAGGALFGSLLMGMFCWPIVLWTARSQPINLDLDDRQQAEGDN